MRRLLSFTLIVGLMGCFGCGRGEQAGFGSNHSQKIIKKIILWHWLTDREEAITELTKRYKGLTGVEVVCELYAPSNAYSQKIMAAGQAKSLPDIYGILGEKRISASFIKAGHISDLTPYMLEDNNAWKNVIFKKALEVNEFLPGNEYGVTPCIYGVPIDVMNIQMLYNKKLFRDAGLDPEMPPKTWDEFISVLEKLKGAGIKGLVAGWGETWLIDCFAHNYAFNIMGEEKVIETIKGNAAYNDPAWIEVFKLFDELARKELLVSGVVSMRNKTAEQLFANEKAAFTFNGSWCVNVYQGMNPDLEYAAFLPPAKSSQHPMVIWGDAGTSFMVNPSSGSKDESIRFLRWLTQKEQQTFLAAETLNLPANRESLDDVPLMLAQFADDMDNVTHPNILPVQENPKVIEAFTKGIQAIIIGMKTPQEIADEVQSVKERVMQEVAP
ncbi:MAG: extracellular solute-binding protein [Candidatus Omnitrophota bacterium]